MTPEVCPNCGAEVPPRAKSCPECGADEETGWSDDAYASNLGIPEDSFNYDDFVEREFGGKKPPRESRRTLWAVVAVIVILAVLLLFL